jgi:hypothetical protein
LVYGDNDVVTKRTWRRVVTIPPINSYQVTLQKTDLYSLLRGARSLLFQFMLRSELVNDPRKSQNIVDPTVFVFLTREIFHDTVILNAM